MCTAEGVDTTLGPEPLRDQLRVDFMITDLLRKVLGKLDWCRCLMPDCIDCITCLCKATRLTRRLPMVKFGLELAMSASQISGQLDPLSTGREVRVLQWQALNREIRERTGTVKLAEPAAKPLRVLPADGAGCVELFIGMPGW